MLSSIGHSYIENISEISIENRKITVSENALENVICKMATVLFRPPYVQLIYFDFFSTRLFFLNDPGSYVQACEMQSAIVTLDDQRKM